MGDSVSYLTLSFRFTTSDSAKTVNSKPTSNIQNIFENKIDYQIKEFRSSDGTIIGEFVYFGIAAGL